MDTDKIQKERITLFCTHEYRLWWNSSRCDEPGRGQRHAGNAPFVSVR
jgi:hypothetical protein